LISKIVTCFIHPKVNIFALGSPIDAKKNIFTPIGVIDFWHEIRLHLNQRGNIPPHAPLQWRSDANCHSALTITMLPLSNLCMHDLLKIHHS